MKRALAVAAGLVLIGAGQAARDPVDPHFAKVSLAEFSFAQVKLALVPPPVDPKRKGMVDDYGAPPLRDEKSCDMSRAQMADSLDILKRAHVVPGARRGFDIDFGFVFVDPRGGLFGLDIGRPRPSDKGAVRVYAGDYVGTLGAVEYARAVKLAAAAGCKP